MAWTRMSKADGLARLRPLVERYAAAVDEVSRPDTAYTETALRGDYLDALLECLGWDVRNEMGAPQRRREVRVEHALRPRSIEEEEAEPGRGRPDYELRTPVEPRLFLEAKKPAVRIRTAPGPAHQTRRYGYSASLPASVLSNFTHLAIYDTRAEPSPHDGPRAGVIAEFDFREYITRFDELWDLLSHETVTGDAYFETYGVDREYRGISRFDTGFLEQIRAWRLTLARAIASANPRLSDMDLGHAVQRLLNALVFLRVCEDRGLEPYGDLLAAAGREFRRLLRRADRRFNAGLFDDLDRLELDANVLRGVVTELYHPSSPYSFAVMEADILAAIYEQFLSERVQRSGDTVELALKPEVAAAGGVVPTPLSVVRELVDRGLGGLEAPPTWESLLSIRVCDPACGSGPFLVEALRRLADHAESILGRDPHFEERRQVLRSCVFGVDIDPEATQVCRFSLLIALLEGRVDAEEPAPVLPDLTANIQVGNSIIDGHFDVVLPELARDAEVQLRVKPFDWRRRFAAVFESDQRGFDLVVSNPPYVRIQNLAAHSPEQYAFLTDQSCGYECTRRYNFDVYQVFLERALTTLASARGMVSMVVPHRFASGAAGAATRRLLGIRGGRHLRRITHFGTEQVFPGRTTYVCLVTASAGANEAVDVEVVERFADWAAGIRGASELRPMEEFGAEPWTFTTPALRELHGRLERDHAWALDDVARVFVGIQTSADAVYFVQPEPGAPGNRVRFTDARGGRWEIELDATRPALLDASITPFDTDLVPDRRVIWPYREETRSTGRRVARLLSHDEMRAQFPDTLRYLESWRERLEERSIQATGPDAWYAYGRSQSLTRLDEEKVIVRVLSLEPQYAIDRRGLVVAGGGDGGPYYLLRGRPESGLTHEYLVAVLSHPAIDSILAAGKRYRGGYIVHRKAFLVGLPIPDPGPRQVEVVELVRDLSSAVVAARVRRDPAEQRVLDDRVVRLRRRLEGVVGELLGLTAEDLALVAGDEGEEPGENDGLDELGELIHQTPDVAGGDACVGDSRIPVWVLVSLRESGLNDDQILESYPTLTHRLLFAAWRYANQNRHEIRQAMDREGDEA